MSKIYSRPRIHIPKIIIQKRKRWQYPKNQKKITITITIIIAVISGILILDAVYPIFDTLCESKAESLATIISNEQATNVMKEHSYDEMFTVEKDINNNITMVKSNIVAINEIISDIAIRIQKSIDKQGREDIEIALRKFYWV